MNLDSTFDSLFLKNHLVCEMCRDELVEHRMVYKINGISYYVLYEYNEFLERLLFQFKEQRDIVLAPLFLHEYKTVFESIVKDNCICVMCSSDYNRMQRAFEPNIEILKGYSVYSPLYKSSHMKQSSLHPSERNKIKSVIHKKECYNLPTKPILLFDDVCTTGNTIQRGVELLHPKCVFLLSAHPIWIEINKSAKQKRF